MRFEYGKVGERHYSLMNKIDLCNLTVATMDRSIGCRLFDHSIGRKPNLIDIQVITTRRESRRRGAVGHIDRPPREFSSAHHFSRSVPNAEDPGFGRAFFVVPVPGRLFS